MSEINMCGAAIYPSVLRGIRDRLGIRVWLSPAQLTAYLDMPGREQLEEHTVMGLPCFVDPTMAQDRIEVLDADGKPIVAIINLAVPGFYAPR